MTSYHSHKSFLFTLLYHAFLLPFVISSPIPNSSYEKFIDFLLKNNCSMPNELKLPFPNSTGPSSFNYLSNPLGQCQTAEAQKLNSEANMLCTEVFDVLKNITCVSYDESLAAVASDHLSTNVCQDFEKLKDILPKNNNLLSGRLSDDVICRILCTAEKYELLCKTLLWSYDTLTKIKHALPSEVQENKNENITKVTPDTVNSSVMPNSVTVELEQNSLNLKESENSKNIDNLHPFEENLLGSNPNQTDQGSHNQKISNDLDNIPLEDISNKKVSEDRKVSGESINKTAGIAKSMAIESLQNISKTQNQKSPLEIPENNIKTIESKNLPNLNLQPEHADDTQSEININEKPPNKDIYDNNPQENLNTNSLTYNANGLKDNQNNKSVTKDNMLNNENGKKDVNSNIGMKSNGKSEESFTPVAGNDNELNSNNFPEEDNKSKTKQKDLENQEVKEIEKPKQADYESPNEVLPDIDSKLPKFSTLSALPDEDIQQQEDKDSDQYNELENEVDYPKPEYDNLSDLSPKNKKSEMKNSIAVGSNQMMNGYDTISPKSKFAVYVSPEQEDSHFFFYFLSIVLIIMAGYLIFHNKQKIIALIVEGRHERRRRSHGAGYKKLETK